MAKIDDLSVSFEDINSCLSTAKDRSVILFADLSNSTLYKQLHPFANGLYKTVIHNKTVTEIVQKHGGRVIKYIGDATMCEFVCSDSQNVVHRAINAAIEIIERFNTHNQDIPEGLEHIETKIGIAYGTVVYFYDQDPQGKVVDLAARIEGMAQPNQILIHKDVMDACDLTRVYSLTGKSLRYESKDYFGVPVKLKLKGIPDPQEIVEVKVQQLFQGIKNEYSEYWEDYRFDALLSQIDKKFIDNKFIRDNYFKIIYDVRFETILNRTRFQFICINNVDEFNHAVPDANLFSLYKLPGNSNINENIEKVFKTEFVMVNDVTLVESSSTHPCYFMQCFSGGDIEKLQGKKVSIRYRISTIISKYAHFYYKTTDYPIKKLSMKFNIGNTDIRQVWVVPQFSSDTIPNITYTPDRKSARGIEVTVENHEWVYPGNGVTFIWRLKSEKPPLQLRRLFS